MAFDEVRISEAISEGSKGGLRYNTIVVSTDSGSEQRIALWQQGRRQWDISYGVKLQADSEALIAFFQAREGRLRGFRFKDADDYEATDAPQTTIAGTPVTIQLHKRYTSGGVNYDRLIAKPVTGTVTLKRNGAAYTDFTVSTVTGIVSLTGATDGVFTASFEFDVPVRFNDDRLEASADSDGYRVWSSIPILEILT